jgi:triphosphoribosyl-dephospho-CoA synthetase
LKEIDACFGIKTVSRRRKEMIKSSQSFSQSLRNAVVLSKKKRKRNTVGILLNKFFFFESGI